MLVVLFKDILCQRYRIPVFKTLHFLDFFLLLVKTLGYGLPLAPWAPTALKSKTC